MKRCIALILSLILILTLAACGTKEQVTASGPKPESPESSTAPESAASSGEPGEADAPEGWAQASQGDEAPDLEAEVTPNPDGQGPSGAEGAVGGQELKNKMTSLMYAVQDCFSKMPESSYNYYYLYHDGESFVLVVGATDEAAVDEGLSSWTGEKWDRLVKEPARFSRAKLRELAEEINTLDLGPVVKINGYVQPPDSDEEIGVLVQMTPKDPEAPPPEDTSRWDEVPKEVEALAGEYGIPMDLIFYRPPVF